MGWISALLPLSSVLLGSKQLAQWDTVALGVLSGVQRPLTLLSAQTVHQRGYGFLKGARSQKPMDVGLELSMPPRGTRGGRAGHKGSWGPAGSVQPGPMAEMTLCFSGPLSCWALPSPRGLSWGCLTSRLLLLRSTILGQLGREVSMSVLPALVRWH